MGPGESASLDVVSLLQRSALRQLQIQGVRVIGEQPLETRFQLTVAVLPVCDRLPVFECANPLTNTL